MSPVLTSVSWPCLAVGSVRSGIVQSFVCWPAQAGNKTTTAPILRRSFSTWVLELFASAAAGERPAANLTRPPPQHAADAKASRSTVGGDQLVETARRD